MNDLPFHLLDNILFRLELKSLAMMRCTNRYINSHISDDPDFESEYSFRVGSSLFHLSSFGAHYVFCKSFSSYDSTSTGNEVELFKEPCYIFGSCSGLLLLYIGDLFVANPLTKRFRVLDHSGSKLMSKIVGGDRNDSDDIIARSERAMCVGFAVNRNRTTKRFKIVCILEMETVYAFEISDGYFWRLSETTVTTTSKSDLTVWMKPVYLDGTLHWLRNDGSIIAFNPETEQARLISSIFHGGETDMKPFFAEDKKNNRLTLITGTKENISVHTLIENSKWTLTKQIKNVSMEERNLVCWNVVAYDGKYLVVREMKYNTFKGVVHAYDTEANTWRVFGSIWCSFKSDRDYYNFTPSLIFVEEDEHKKVIVASNDLRMSYLNAVMGLIDTY